LELRPFLLQENGQFLIRVFYDSMVAVATDTDVLDSRDVDRMGYVLEVVPYDTDTGPLLDLPRSG